MEESSRISRGNCKDMKTLNSGDFDALLIPGGFGAAKNLSNFAFLGADGDENKRGKLLQPSLQNPI